MSMVQNARKSIVLSLLLILSAISSPSWAHDYWIQPEQFRWGLGKPVKVHLFVGDHFKQGSERPYQAKMTVSFHLIGAKGKRDIAKKLTEGVKPIATVQTHQAGSHLIAMERDWSRIELTAKKFNSYLEHEGLQAILKKRRLAGELKTVGRERYRRYLKSLITAEKADSASSVYGQRLGHRLEIVPLSDPRRPGRSQSDSIRFQVWFDGKPLNDAQVEAYHRNGDQVKEQHGRTDKRGRVTFKIDRPGIWLVRLVHMQRCKDEKGIDWESFWSSYSFEVASSSKSD